MFEGWTSEDVLLAEARPGVAYVGVQYSTSIEPSPVLVKRY
jgi:hypothetical protein